MNRKKTIFLNYIPPIRNIYPSAGLSILKSFLQQNGWSCNVKYWNILMEHVMADYPYSDKRDMLPFMYMLAKEYHDFDAENSIINYLKNQKPEIKSENQYSDFMNQAVAKIQQIIDVEFNKINPDEVLIFGLSLKFYQFIPAIFFARALKRKFPNLFIVIGGIRNKSIAMEYMEMCCDFDFAIWGEGEYPLLQLCELLQSNQKAFSKIPRLIFRSDKTICISEISKGQFLDFKKYIFPDYSDYVITDKSAIIFPVNSVRSCYWDKCKFCIFGEDYVYRERDPENIIQEIEALYHQYGMLHFHFIDNDVIGTKPKRFEKLLDLLIESKAKLNVKYTFWAEIIHKNITAEMFRKMELAGFRSVNFGIEGISESLLRKMNKKTSFADNLFALKTAARFNIQPGGNIIYNLPDETKDDVKDSINNLHYMRFLFADNIHPFSFSYRDFVLQKGTGYFDIISDEIVEQHTFNHIAALLPKKFFENRNRFNLFGYSRQTINVNEWNEFKLFEVFYKQANYTYEFTQNERKIVYAEYKNGKLLYSFIVDEIRLAILKMLDDKIYSFNTMCSLFNKINSDICEEKLIAELIFLKEKQVVYFDDEMKNITSVVLTSKLE